MRRRISDGSPNIQPCNHENGWARCGHAKWLSFVGNRVLELSQTFGSGKLRNCLQKPGCVPRRQRGQREPGHARCSGILHCAFQQGVHHPAWRVGAAQQVQCPFMRAGVERHEGHDVTIPPRQITPLTRDIVTLEMPIEKPCSPPCANAHASDTRSISSCGRSPVEVFSTLASRAL